MRIIAGRFRGRKLTSPKDACIRPTPDRVRGALFDILSSRPGTDFSGLRVLDLFAGTGAFGLEAISRGAKEAVFVDNDPGARGLIREHIEIFALATTARLLRRDATDLGPLTNMEPFNLVFCDPPYGQGLGQRALKSAAAGGWIAPGALVLVEEERRVDFETPPGFFLDDQRDYGDTSVRFFRFKSKNSPA